MGLSFIVFGLEWLTFLSFIGWLYYTDNLKQFTKKQIIKDEERTEILNSNALEIIRFKNEERNF